MSDADAFWISQGDLEALNAQLAALRAALKDAAAVLPDPDTRPQWGLTDYRVAVKVGRARILAGLADARTELHEHRGEHEA